MLPSIIMVIFTSPPGDTTMQPHTLHEQVSASHNALSPVLAVFHVWTSVFEIKTQLEIGLDYLMPVMNLYCIKLIISQTCIVTD